MNLSRLLAVTLFCACVFIGLVQGADNKASNKDTRALHALLTAEWDHAMEQSPTWASSLGDRRWNDRWGDVSLAAIEKNHAHDQDALARLRTIDRRKLSSADH